jgi:hypothetical protein
MIIPPADINWFAEQFADISQEMLDAWEDAGKPTVGDEPSPDLLCDAMDQLIDLLKIIDSGTPKENDPSVNEDADITELGDYGLSILEEFINLAEAFNLPEQIPNWEQLSIALGRWVIIHEGEVSILSSVVNGLAYLANHTTEQVMLEGLYLVMSEIVEAVPLSSIEDSDSDDPLEPWRILIFNRAIVATRVFSPRLMDESFRDIAEYFPNEAPDFFREGMEQMDIQGYPQEVREVMESYYNTWPMKRTLH